jgi:hypothetical protein
VLLLPALWTSLASREHTLLGTYQVQPCNQGTIMEVEESFQKYTREGGKVILKYDTRGRVVSQNDCLGCTVAPGSLIAPDMFPTLFALKLNKASYMNQLFSKSVHLIH